MTSPGQPLLASLLPTSPLQPLAAGLAPPLAVTLASGCACVRVRCFVHFCPALLMSSCTVLYCPAVLCTTVQLYCVLLSSCTMHYQPTSSPPPPHTPQATVLRAGNSLTPQPLCAVCSVQRAACSVQRAACSVQCLQGAWREAGRSAVAGVEWGST